MRLRRFAARWGAMIAIVLGVAGASGSLTAFLMNAATQHDTSVRAEGQEAGVTKAWKAGMDRHVAWGEGRSGEIEQALVRVNTNIGVADRRVEVFQAVFMTWAAAVSQHLGIAAPPRPASIQRRPSPSGSMDLYAAEPEPPTDPPCP